jgi:hypothetical protein
MGLNHGAQVDQCEPGKGHRTAITPYANGFAVGACDGKAAPGKFGDIMVGGWMKAISGDGRAYLPLYSNASLSDPRCGQDQRCGDAATGDAANPPKLR